MSGQRNNLYLVAPARSEIQSIRDLKGRTVSIFRGTNGHLVAINVLAANGLAERDIKGVNLDTGSSQAALVSNGVDAAFGGYEWFKVRDQGLAKVVYSTRGQDSGFTRQAALLDGLLPDVVLNLSDPPPAPLGMLFAPAVREVWLDEKNRDELFPLGPQRHAVASWTAEFDQQSLALRTLRWSTTSSSRVTRPWRPTRSSWIDSPGGFRRRLVRPALPEGSPEEAGPRELLGAVRRQGPPEGGPAGRVPLRAGH